LKGTNVINFDAILKMLNTGFLLQTTSISGFDTCQFLCRLHLHRGLVYTCALCISHLPLQHFTMREEVCVEGHGFGEGEKSDV